MPEIGIQCKEVEFFDSSTEKYDEMQTFEFKNSVFDQLNYNGTPFVGGEFNVSDSLIAICLSADMKYAVQLGVNEPTPESISMGGCFYCKTSTPTTKETIISKLQIKNSNTDIFGEDFSHHMYKSRVDNTKEGIVFLSIFIGSTSSSDPQIYINELHKELSNTATGVWATSKLDEFLINDLVEANSKTSPEEVCDSDHDKVSKFNNLSCPNNMICNKVMIIVPVVALFLGFIKFVYI